MTSGISDDYAVLDAGRYQFYFGYEHTVCPRHGNDSDCECDDIEWAFVVKENGIEKLRSAPKYNGRTEEPVTTLLACIEKFGAKEWPKP